MPLSAKLTGVSLFSNVRGLAYHTSNKEDPYIELGDDEDDELEEMQDMVIAPTDNLIVAAKTEDDISHLEIYVYEEDEDNLFVHHDILLPSFPLCLEWLDFPVGSQLGSDRPGNYIAVGTFEPQVEIWNLDLVDSMFPDCILGEIPSNKGQSDDGSGIGGGKKKKKKFGPMRTARRPNADYHIDAVMAIAWNTVQRNLIATGSADTTVKLWDLNRPSSAIANYTMPHNNKVQAVCWNKAEPAVLLTGGYDQRVCAFDSRAPDTVAAWKLTADVECLKWDPLHSERFMVSTEDGIVKAFDVRTGGGDKAKALFTLQAHDSAVSALDISPFHDGLMVTGSADKNVKIWSIKDNKPACIVSRDVDTGKVFSANFSPDSPYLVSLAGSKGRVVVWNLETNGAVRRAYPPRQHGQVRSMVLFDDDDDDDDDDDGQMYANLTESHHNPWPKQKAEPKPERKEITIMEPDDEPDEDEANLQLEVPVHDEDIGEADEDDDAIEEDDE
eukprot:jgi/Hompol1/196/HPOL_005262-RA